MESLNAEQIKKALECCASEGCETCPYQKMPTLANCVLFTMGNALTLIKELTEDLAKALEENKRLARERDCAIVVAKMGGAPFPEGLEIVHGFCQKEIRKEKEAVLNNVRWALMERVRGIYLDENELSAILDGIINLLLKEDKE